MAPPNPQNLQWTDVLCCSVCSHIFNGTTYDPVSLSCNHIACRVCLTKLRGSDCPFDHTPISVPIHQLLSNTPLLRILAQSGECMVDERTQTREMKKRLAQCFGESTQDAQDCEDSMRVFEQLALYFRKAQSERGGSVWSPELSRPMQRKLVTLICTQLMEPQGRSKALKAARYLGERSLTELLLLHQNPHHLSTDLWSAVRARGCQFLGPAMQEEVLRLILLTLSEGAMISRKTLVLYIVQTLFKDYPQASKTSVGHVVQLLYRASCFNVVKRDGESSLMQLKDEFRSYDSLRREHDSQIVHIAMESGLRISPDQWSALLYGDQSHRSHMQSIIDKLQSPLTFGLSIQELVITLQRVGDPEGLSELLPHFEQLAAINSVTAESSENTKEPTWSELSSALQSTLTVVKRQVSFCQRYGSRTQAARGTFRPSGSRNQQSSSSPASGSYPNTVIPRATYQIGSGRVTPNAGVPAQLPPSVGICREFLQSGQCQRGLSCPFRHSLDQKSPIGMNVPMQDQRTVAVNLASSSRQSAHSSSLPLMATRPQMMNPEPRIIVSLPSAQNINTAGGMTLTPAQVGVITTHQFCPTQFHNPPRVMTPVIPSGLAPGYRLTHAPPSHSHQVPTPAPSLCNPTPAPMMTNPPPSLAKPVVGPATLYLPSGIRPTFLTSEQTAYYPPTARFVLIQTTEEQNSSVPIQPLFVESRESCQPKIPEHERVVQPQPFAGFHATDGHGLFSLPYTAAFDQNADTDPNTLQQLRNKRDEILRRLHEKQQSFVTTDDYDYAAASLSYSIASSVLQEPREQEPYNLLQRPPSLPQWTPTNQRPSIKGQNTATDAGDGWCPFSDTYPTWLPQLTNFGVSPPMNKQTSVVTSQPTTVICGDPTTLIKNSIPKPVPTPLVQSHQLPVASYDSVDPQTIVDHLPRVIRAKPLVPMETQVEEGINRIVEVKECLGQIPSQFPITASAVEKEHLKWELHIVNNQIKTMDDDTELEVLEKELNCVRNQISELEIS